MTEEEIKLIIDDLRKYGDGIVGKHALNLVSEVRRLTGRLKDLEKANEFLGWSKSDMIVAVWDYKQEVVCPWCEYHHTESWDIPAGEDYSCHECGRLFEIDRMVTTEYRTRKVDVCKCGRIVAIRSDNTTKAHSIPGTYEPCPYRITK